METFRIDTDVITIPHSNACVTNYNDRYLFLIGGSDVNNNTLNTTSIYDTYSETWSTLKISSMIKSRSRSSCNIINDFLYIIAGDTDNTIERIYIGDINNINDYQWELLNSSLISNHNLSERICSVSIQEKYIFFIGNNEEYVNRIEEEEVYQDAELPDTIQSIDSMITINDALYILSNNKWYQSEFHASSPNIDFNTTYNFFTTVCSIINTLQFVPVHVLFYCMVLYIYRYK